MIIIAKKIFTSPKFSFKGWDVIVWLKGRKKSAIAVIASLIMFFLTDEALASIIAGVIVEGAIAIGEYYFKEVEL